MSTPYEPEANPPVATTLPEESVIVYVFPFHPSPNESNISKTTELTTHPEHEPSSTVANGS